MGKKLLVGACARGTVPERAWSSLVVLKGARVRQSSVHRSHTPNLSIAGGTRQERGV